MKKKNVFYDKKADILYIVLKEGNEEYAEEIAPNIFVEFNKKGEPIGIEILNASSVVKEIKNDEDKIYPTLFK